MYLSGVRLSVYLSRSPAAAAGCCCGLGGQEISVDRAAACGQCHVVSWCKRLNVFTDLLNIYDLISLSYMVA